MKKMLEDTLWAQGNRMYAIVEMQDLESVRR